MPVSQNGYIACDISRTRLWKIRGTDTYVRLRRGAPGRLLWELASWFHGNVEPIDQGQRDDWGYAERQIRDSRVWSNHSSGTAIDLNALKHPMGKRGTFTDRQQRAIQRWLSDHDGCVRWGGNYRGRPDEMHFEIAASVEACRRALYGS